MGICNDAWNRVGSLLPPFDNNVVQLGRETGRFDKLEVVTDKVDKVEGVAEKVDKVEQEQQPPQNYKQTKELVTVVSQDNGDYLCGLG